MNFEKGTTPLSIFPNLPYICPKPLFQEYNKIKQTMPITKDWLRQAANAQSFSKGESYYNNVEDLVKQGDTY